MEFGNRASIIRWPKPNRKQQAQARAIVLLNLLPATALPHVHAVVVEALHRRLAACRHAPCRCLACVTPLIARPSVAAGHHERDGLAAGQRPCPCCAVPVVGGAGFVGRGATGEHDEAASSC